MIDTDPTNLSCTYSTLCVVSSEAKGHNMHPILAFDQTLWWKARMIIAGECTESDPRSIILRLGAFNIKVSFLGALAISYLGLA